MREDHEQAGGGRPRSRRASRPRSPAAAGRERSRGTRPGRPARSAVSALREKIGSIVGNGIVFRAASRPCAPPYLAKEPVRSGPSRPPPSAPTPATEWHERHDGPPASKRVGAREQVLARVRRRRRPGSVVGRRRRRRRRRRSALSSASSRRPAREAEEREQRPDLGVGHAEIRHRHAVLVDELLRDRVAGGDHLVGRQDELLHPARPRDDRRHPSGRVRRACRRRSCGTPGRAGRRSPSRPRRLAAALAGRALPRRASAPTITATAAAPARLQLPAIGRPGCSRPKPHSPKLVLARGGDLISFGQPADGAGPRPTALCRASTSRNVTSAAGRRRTRAGRRIPARTCRSDP